MQLPKNYTEDEVIKIIDNIVNRLAGLFKFGYHDIDDIKQEGRYEALKALPRYDEKRPLENFLFTHVRNRYINYKRDNYSRYDKPCITCLFYDPEYKKSKNQCAAYTDKTVCKPYHSWTKRNSAKKNIMQPIHMENSGDILSLCDSVYEDLNYNELKQFIDDHLDLEYRSDYLRILDGCYVPKQRKLKIQTMLRDIFHKYTYGKTRSSE